jgi:hypothetical protein
VTDLYEILDTVRRVVPGDEGHELAEIILRYATGIVLTASERSQLVAWREQALR